MSTEEQNWRNIIEKKIEGVIEHCKYRKEGVLLCALKEFGIDDSKASRLLEERSYNTGFHDEIRNKGYERTSLDDDIYLLKKPRDLATPIFKMEMIFSDPKGEEKVTYIVVGAFLLGLGTVLYDNDTSFFPNLHNKISEIEKDLSKDSSGLLTNALKKFGLSHDDILKEINQLNERRDNKDIDNKTRNHGIDNLNTEDTCRLLEKDIIVNDQKNMNNKILYIVVGAAFLLVLSISVVARIKKIHINKHSGREGDDHGQKCKGILGEAVEAVDKFSHWISKDSTNSQVVKDEMEEYSVLLFFSADKLGGKVKSDSLKFSELKTLIYEAVFFYVGLPSETDEMLKQLDLDDNNDHLQDDEVIVRVALTAKSKIRDQTSARGISNCLVNTDDNIIENICVVRGFDGMEKLKRLV